MSFVLSTGNKILANPIYRYTEDYLCFEDVWLKQIFKILSTLGCLVEIDSQDPLNALKYFILPFSSCLLLWLATFLAFMFPAIYYQYAGRADLLLNFQMNYLQFFVETLSSDFRPVSFECDACLPVDDCLVCSHFEMLLLFVSLIFVCCSTLPL